MSVAAMDEHVTAWTGILPEIYNHNALWGIEVSNESEVWGQNGGSA